MRGLKSRLSKEVGMSSHVVYQVQEFRKKGSDCEWTEWRNCSKEEYFRLVGAKRFRVRIAIDRKAPVVVHLPADDSEGGLL